MQVCGLLSRHQLEWFYTCDSNSFLNGTTLGNLQHDDGVTLELVERVRPHSTRNSYRCTFAATIGYNADQVAGIDIDMKLKATPQPGRSEPELEV